MDHSLLNIYYIDPNKCLTSSFPGRYFLLHQLIHSILHYYFIFCILYYCAIAMASFNHSGYEKFAASAPGAAPPQFGEAAATTGIPVSSSNQYYTESSDIKTRLQTKTRVPWSSGLCDCFSDWRNCCMTCWCPCVTFGQIAEIVDKGSSSCGVNGALYTLIACVTGCACCYSCFYRSKMRQQYMLKKNPCGDCLVHCFCEYCALCQEYRELQSHGYDLSIGWHGNMEKQNREVAMTPIPPVVEGGMSR